MPGEVLVHLEVAGVRGNDFRIELRSSGDVRAVIKIGPGHPAIRSVLAILNGLRLKEGSSLAKEICTVGGIPADQLASALTVYSDPAQFSLIFRIKASPPNDWQTGPVSDCLNGDFLLFRTKQNSLVPSDWRLYQEDRGRA